MSMAIGSLGSSSASLAQMRQELFKKLDGDGDGKISKTEFASIQNSQDSTKAEELFAQIDTDQNGSISETEHDAFLGELEKSRKKEEPSASAAGQDWQTSLLQSLLTNATRDTEQSCNGMSLYV